MFWQIFFGAIALTGLALLLPGRTRQTAEAQAQPDVAESVEV